jgi:hypothetical protein
MSKMGSHDPFRHLKHKLWPKEGWESNWQFDSWPLKFKSRPNFLAWRWRATYHYKAFDEGYNFALNLISIGGLHTKLWAPKVIRVPTLGILGLPLGVPGQNDIWVMVPWPGTKYTIRGKVVASPKSEPWWVLWVHVCPWLVCAPKCFNYALNNWLLVCAGPCEWLNCLSIFLVPSLSSNMPLYPPKCHEPRSASNSFSFWCLHLWTCNWVHQRA